jgi:site-specific recombinase XerD
MSSEPVALPPSIAHISPQTTLVPAIRGWRIFLEDQSLSPHTIKAFIGDMNLLASYLPPDRDLNHISTNDLNHFLNWLQHQRGVPCSPKTLARRITSLKAFFRWLHQNGVLLIDPAEKVLQQSVLSPLPEILSPDETASVLEAADRHRQGSKPDARYKTLVLLLLSTGIKKSECLALTLNHIDLESPNGPQLFVRYASPQNRYKERKISLPLEWGAVFEEYKIQYNLTDAIFPWSQRRLEYLLEDLSEEAGLTKHLSFDMCRWTSAVSDWQSNMEPNKIRQKLGVSKIQWRELKMKIERLAGKQAGSPEETVKS